MNTYRVLYRKTFPRVTGVTPDFVVMTDYDEVITLANEYPITEGGLEVVFRDMNAVDGDELCCTLKVRSMSVGDVVITHVDDQNERAYYCAPSGWKLIEVVQAA